MGTTAVHAYPYPEGSDQPVVHLDLKAAVDDIDLDTFVPCTSATRPAHVAGRRIFETDTFSSHVSDGTLWRPLDPKRTYVQASATAANRPDAAIGGIGTPTLSGATAFSGSWAAITDGVSIPVAGLYAGSLTVTLDTPVTGRSFVEVRASATSGSGTLLARVPIEINGGTATATFAAWPFAAADPVTGYVFQTSGGLRTATSTLRMTRIGA